MPPVQAAHILHQYSSYGCLAGVFVLICNEDDEILVFQVQAGVYKIINEVRHIWLMHYIDILWIPR